MKREEKIEILQAAFEKLDRMVKWYHGIVHNLVIEENDIKALEVGKIAIEALKIEPYFWEKCPYYEPDIMFDGEEEYDCGKCIYKTEHSEDRKNCPHRHENGNCLSVGGFCLAVDDQHCQLKNEPCGKDTNVPITDTISRRAVKEKMIKYGFHAPDMTVTEFVEDLLPVQPEQKEITMEDVKAYCEPRNLVVVTKELYDQMQCVYSAINSLCTV